MISVTPEQANGFIIRAVDDEGNILHSRYPEYPEILTTDKLLVGFDQSTTQTGMFVKTVDGTPVLTVDFVNKISLPHALYEQMMLIMLKKMFTAHKVELVVIEKPFGQKSKISFEAMIKLKGFMETLMYTIPSFNGVKLGEIYPQSWRKEFLKNPKYNGRKKATSDLKQCAREESVDRYPNLATYMYAFAGGVPDSADAIGVLEGYLATNYKGGFKVINTTMKANFAVKYDYFIAHIKPDEVKMFLQEQSPQVGWYRGFDIVLYNPDLTLANNCQRAVSETNKIMFLAVTDLMQTSIMMWESGIPMKEGNVYYIVCWRENIDERFGLNGTEENKKEWGLT